MLTCFDY